MPRVMRRPLAQTDILEIWDFIADDSVAAADRWVDHLDDQFRLLATQPIMGRAREELSPGVRSFPIRRYSSPGGLAVRAAPAVFSPPGALADTINRRNSTNSKGGTRSSSKSP